MRFYSLLDFQWAVLAFFVGLISALVLYLAFRGTKEEMEEEAETVEYLEGLRETTHPTPPVLIFLYVGFIIWAFVYIVFIALQEGSL